MNREKVLLRIWTCMTIVLCSFYVIHCVFDTVKVFVFSNGTEITLDFLGIGEFALILCVYFTTKVLLRDKQ